MSLAKWSELYPSIGLYNKRSKQRIIDIFLKEKLYQKYLPKQIGEPDPTPMKYGKSDYKNALVVKSTSFVELFQKMLRQCTCLLCTGQLFQNGLMVSNKYIEFGKMEYSILDFPKMQYPILKYSKKKYEYMTNLNKKPKKKPMKAELSENDMFLTFQAKGQVYMILVKDK